jgi:hypothetical protein
MQYTENPTVSEGFALEHCPHCSSTLWLTFWTSGSQQIMNNHCKKFSTFSTESFTECSNLLCLPDVSSPVWLFLRLWPWLTLLVCEHTVSRLSLMSSADAQSWSQLFPVASSESVLSPRSTQFYDHSTLDYNCICHELHLKQMSLTIFLKPLFWLLVY